MPTIYWWTQPQTVDQDRYNVLITRPGYFASSTPRPPDGTQQVGNISAADLALKASKYVTETKTTNFVAVPGRVYLMDTTSGTVTATLPAANAGGDSIIFKWSAGTNAANITRTGTDTIGAISTTVTLNLSMEIWEFISSGVGQWNLTGGNKALASLDSRYYTDLAPVDIGLLAWSMAPTLQNIIASAFTAGRLQLIRLKRVPAGPVTNIGTLIASAGVSLTTGQCFAALYKPDRTLVGITADQSTSWSSPGTKTMPLITPYANPTISDLIVGWWANGTTTPGLARMANNNVTLFNGTLTEGNYISAQADTGLTTAAPNPYGVTLPNTIAYYWNVS